VRDEPPRCHSGRARSAARLGLGERVCEPSPCASRGRLSAGDGAGRFGLRRSP
jgi:hypothetical protein